MTSTTTATDAKAVNFAKAEAFLAVANTLNDVGVTAWGINVTGITGPIQVDVLLRDRDVASVDLLAVHLGLDHDEQKAGIYLREGDPVVYGHSLYVRVYCGRPESMRQAAS